MGRRLDKFKEILDGYEGRDRMEYAKKTLRSRLCADTCAIYDTLDPELQQRFIKYFCYADTTGKIKILVNDVIGIMKTDFNEFFNDLLLDLARSEHRGEIKEVLRTMDEIIESYEKDDSSGEVVERYE